MNRFALLTGKPPFQAATQEEIYRRARELEYDWPKLNTSENFISDEVKNLVASLLQAPEQRPDPDTIVQHPFFISGWVPQPEEMKPSLRERHPDPIDFLSYGSRGGRTNLYKRNLKKLCIKCDVGPWNTASQPAITVYKEFTEEEKAHLTPVVPLAGDIVYRPFSQWKEEQAQQAQLEPQKSENTNKIDTVRDGALSPEPKKVKTSEASSSRPTTQSFAAQQRARASAPVSNGSLLKLRQPSQESSSRGMSALPSRVRARKTEERSSEDTAAVQERLAVDLVNQLNDASVEQKKPVAKPSPATTLSIFSQEERPELVNNTKPDAVLDGLRRLQAELERVLNTRTMAIEIKSPPAYPIVVKWVDYTNKYGLGYVLSNGSIGSIFTGFPADFFDLDKGSYAPACLVVRDAERHLQSKRNDDYPDRHEIVPISGPNIEFYENRSENGLVRVKVNPMNYKVVHGPDGVSPKLPLAKNECDARKRELLILWKKLSNYMCSFDKDENFPHDEALSRKKAPAEAVAAGNVVTFYQRWGDVGCWAFCDGHFQVMNAFPIMCTPI